jgi:dTDP-4-dehydrorhamnose 3,5-epimerase
MIFIPTQLEGAFLIRPELQEDQRGFFSRTWCENEFREQGLAFRPAQCSISFNHRKGTLRGMHYQAAPHAEAKLVRCTAGAIYDVILDLRPHSPTFKKWAAVQLTSSNRWTAFVPKGCAHGFQTLSDDTEVFYQISTHHRRESARGVRFDDPVFGIEWPLEVTCISEQDRRYPDISP